MGIDVHQAERWIGPALSRSIVYSVARTESKFNQPVVSPAKAVGLMQVTPEAGLDTGPASFLIRSTTTQMGAAGWPRSCGSTAAPTS